MAVTCEECTFSFLPVVSPYLTIFIRVRIRVFPRGVLDFGLDGGMPPGPRDPNPCLEVKKEPMFRDFAQKMDPCLGMKNGPLFRDLGVKNGTHV